VATIDGRPRPVVAKDKSIAAVQKIDSVCWQEIEPGEDQWAVSAQNTGEMWN